MTTRRTFETASSFLYIRGKMNKNIWILIIVLVISFVNYFCFGDYYISELLNQPLAIWLAFFLFQAFKTDKKNTLTIISAITCGVIFTVILNYERLSWSLFMLKILFSIIGGGVLWLYAKNWSK
ncbi:MAG: hypothetical protein LBL90_07500 [Prevotellaceae bacterium]|jgi:putative effector of murein hydrolase|nr:hypothetical protein [Prevotellaceae bacterium]